MTLPGASVASISEEKIVEYLLNLAHPEGAGKAKFFLALGFSPENWQALANALRDLALNSPVANRVENKHGTKYGALIAPDGRSVSVRTIWIVDYG